MSQVPNNCEGCGACCGNTSDTKWIEVTANDAAVIAPKLLQPGDIEPFAMKQKPNGECICLDRDKRCVIYDKRPTICRAVQRGDVVCLTSLRRR